MTVMDLGRRSPPPVIPDLFRDPRCGGMKASEVQGVLWRDWKGDPIERQSPEWNDLLMALRLDRWRYRTVK
ncbi:hypothetical protein FHS95_003637 [Sphingomonas naasensis]|nr:hypothetical protein [Sphingomonas naasensis]